MFNGQSHTTEIQLNSQTPIVAPPINYTNTTTATLNPNIPIISKTERTEAVSNFSIKSVHLKTEHQRNFKEVVIDPNTLPRESFSEEIFNQFWERYINELLVKGERIQASILKIAILRLEGTTIHLEVSSNTAKNDIVQMEHKLLNYLHKSLQNYDLTIEISVNEEIAKRIVVTPEDKYEKLLEENPILQEFRRAFELNLKG